jgi:tripartite ATP-independent transporter DctM subunit
MTAAIATGLLLLALARTPLFAIIAAVALIGFYRSGTDLSVVAIEIYRLAEMPVLVAIPLFTFAGYLLGESQAPTRIVRLTNALLGWLPGGLPIVAIVACAGFTAFTGASGITIVALGALLYPALMQAGYPERFSLGLVTTSGSLGLLFAPSLPLILYGVIAQQQGVGAGVAIDELFIAGILPGLLMLILLSGWSMTRPRTATALPPPAGRGEVLAALREAAWEIPLPFVVLGGIYGGWFAVSEAAIVTAAYVFLVEVVILREIAWRRLPSVTRDAMVLVGGILIILGVSLASTNFLIDVEVPARLFDLISTHVEGKWTFLVLLNVFLLALGMTLDIFSALVIVVPIILPIAVRYGIDPLHLGIVFLANMQIGYLTPPVGMNLFIASYRFERSVVEVYRATIPFFLLLLVALIIITYWSGLSLGPVHALRDP